MKKLYLLPIAIATIFVGYNFKVVSLIVQHPLEFINLAINIDEINAKALAECQKDYEFVKSGDCLRENGWDYQSHDELVRIKAECGSFNSNQKQQQCLTRYGFNEGK